MVFLPIIFWPRHYWSSWNHPLMANIWKKAILILARNLNSGLSYLVITVPLLILQFVHSIFSFPYEDCVVGLGLQFQVTKIFNVGGFKSTLVYSKVASILWIGSAKLRKYLICLRGINGCPKVTHWDFLFSFKKIEI